MAVCVLLTVLVLIHQQEIKQQGQPLQQEDTGKEIRSGVVALNQSCCSTALQYKVEFLCSRELSSLVSHCSCSDYLMCKLVMVTALSSNHFVESIDFFGSVYAHFPRVKVVVYDLGLAMNEVSRIQSYCNVLEVRKFNFNSYPSHVKNLHNYAWKMFIISEISEQYEVFFYCDASCRMLKILPDYLPDLLKFPVLPATWLGSSIVKTTHDGMLQYLNVQHSRQELERLVPRGFQATAVVYWTNSVLREAFLPAYVDCASYIECIAPEGSHRWGCNFSVPGYAGCHRYDQSAQNILLLRDFGDALATLYREREGEPLKLVDVQRDQTTLYNNSMSNQCNISYTVPEEAQDGISVFLFVLLFALLVLFVAGICKLTDCYIY